MNGAPDCPALVRSCEWDDEDYDVLADGEVVGCIFKANAAWRAVEVDIGIRAPAKTAAQRTAGTRRGSFWKKTGMWASHIQILDRSALENISCECTPRSGRTPIRCLGSGLPKG
jgi:hypothetical protein